MGRFGRLGGCEGFKRARTRRRKRWSYVPPHHARKPTTETERVHTIPVQYARGDRPLQPGQATERADTHVDTVMRVEAPMWLGEIESTRV